MFKKFSKGIKVTDAVSIGIIKKVDEWLIDNGTTGTGFTSALNKENKVIIIEVDGVVVLKNYEILNVDGIKGLYDVKIVPDTWSIEILDKIDKDILYERIRYYYNQVLDNCLDKSLEEQYKYLFPESRITIFPPPVYLKKGEIERSEQYIRNLPDNPSIEQMDEFAEKIISGNLEYGYYAEDKYGIIMKQYAEELKVITSNT
jgi:hypothetical protein